GRVKRREGAGDCDGRAAQRPSCHCVEDDNGQLHHREPRRPLESWSRERRPAQACRPAGTSARLPFSYQPLLRLTIHTTVSMTGTSMRTPTTVASAAPELKPNRLIAAATASSKKLLAPISADGPATQCCSPASRLRR